MLGPTPTCSITNSVKFRCRSTTVTGPLLLLCLVTKHDVSLQPPTAQPRHPRSGTPPMQHHARHRLSGQAQCVQRPVPPALSPPHRAPAQHARSEATPPPVAACQGVSAMACRITAIQHDGDGIAGPAALPCIAGPAGHNQPGKRQAYGDVHPCLARQLSRDPKPGPVGQILGCM